MHKKILMEKMKEAAASVLPVTVIVLAVCLLLVPVESGLMLAFLIGSAMLIAGIGLFSLGAEMSMTRIGSLIGAKMTKSRKLGVILLVSFLLGAAITVAEPDLQVLATNVPNIDKTVLILTVSVGVGLFLMLCMVRILFSISLKWLLRRCLHTRRALPDVDASRLQPLALQIIRLIAALADLNADDLVLLQHIAHEHRHIRLNGVADAVCQPRVGLVHIVNAGHIALIVNADIDHTAIRVRKGDDFLVNIICQLGFKFHALVFVLHRSHLRVGYFYYTIFFI